jgi:hypothetical protein
MGIGVGNTKGAGTGVGRTNVACGRQASSVPNAIAKENTASLRKITPVLPNPLNRKFAKLSIHPELPSLADWRWNLQGGPGCVNWECFRLAGQSKVVRKTPTPRPQNGSNLTENPSQPRP